MNPVHRRTNMDGAQGAQGSTGHPKPFARLFWLLGLLNQKKNYNNSPPRLLGTKWGQVSLPMDPMLHSFLRT